MPDTMLDIEDCTEQGESMMDPTHPTQQQLAGFTSGFLHLTSVLGHFSWLITLSLRLACSGNLYPI